jgi:hypothetical protein
MKFMVLKAVLILMVFSSIQAFDTNPQLANLSDNTLLDLDSLKLQSPVGESQYYANGVTAYGGMVYDMNNHRMIMWGGGHATTFTDAVYAFDFSTLKWSALYTPTPTAQMNMGNFNSTLVAWQNGNDGPFPRPISRHSYDLLVVPEGRDELYMLREVGGGGRPDGSYREGQVTSYDFKNNTWNFIPNFNTDDHATAEYDPVSGKIIIVKTCIWVYDLDTKVCTKVKTLPYGSMGYADQLVYYPPNQKMYYFKRGSSGATYEITLDRNDFTKTTCVALSTTGSKSPHGEPGYAYDSVNEIIGGGISGNKFYIFNPMTRQWSSQTMHGGSPGDMVFHCIDYDPVNNVFIFVHKTSWWLQKTWAYRYKAGSTGVARAGQGGSRKIMVSPNPFSSKIKIAVSCQPSAVSKVNLQIFNINGKIVKKLTATDSRQLIAGITWNASNLPCGLYLLKLNSAGKTITKRLFLQK